MAHFQAAIDTALVLNVAAHTSIPSVTTSERTADGRARKRFAASGQWDAAVVTRARLSEQDPGLLGYGFHVSAVDATTVPRSDEPDWGTSMFHEDTARGPNRAATVRAHHGVVLGARLPHPDQPAWFLPVSGRLDFRKSQWPTRSGAAGPREAFRTESEPAIARLREQARVLGGRHLGVGEGGLGAAARGPARGGFAPDRILDAVAT